MEHLMLLPLGLPPFSSLNAFPFCLRENLGSNVVTHLLLQTLLYRWMLQLCETILHKYVQTLPSASNAFSHRTRTQEIVAYQPQ
jgi:hypothetical protein